MCFYIRWKYTTSEEYLFNKSKELPLPHYIIGKLKKRNVYASDIQHQFSLKNAGGDCIL